MPGPWRPTESTAEGTDIRGFNLRRDARPLATYWTHKRVTDKQKFKSQTRCQAPGDHSINRVSTNGNMCFNLRRDARPLATHAPIASGFYDVLFQSQTRCQTPGDLKAPHKLA